MEYYSVIKKNQTLPFAATWINHTVKFFRQRQIPYDITYTWSLKHNRNEFIYKTERGSQT